VGNSPIRFRVWGEISPHRGVKWGGICPCWVSRRQFWYTCPRPRSLWRPEYECTTRPNSPPYSRPIPAFIYNTSKTLAEFLPFPSYPPSATQPSAPHSLSREPSPVTRRELTNSRRSWSHGRGDTDSPVVVSRSEVAGRGPHKLATQGCGSHTGTHSTLAALALASTLAPCPHALARLSLTLQCCIEGTREGGRSRPEEWREARSPESQALH
jgi:hypothetical protein